MNKRIEKDSMGEVEVPSDALYGAQTRRAELNFPVSGYKLPLDFIHNLALIKACCAIVNQNENHLDKALADLIVESATEIIDGKYDDQFIVDVFQTGSGTSTNMNMNEVIANLSNLKAGKERGIYDPVHPNDHVNMGHSSNDIIPTVMNVSTLIAVINQLIPALEKLKGSLSNKSNDFHHAIKTGRTHLNDATPIRMGQVFSGYSFSVGICIDQLNSCMPRFASLPIGGSAVGTGMNAVDGFGCKIAVLLSKKIGYEFTETENHFSAQSTATAIVETASTLKTVAISIEKIADDIRYLGSGPRCGIGELDLPEIQPGSSMMPGKVNPVICESVMQVSAYVVGVDASISHAASTLSNFELCTAFPLMTSQILEAIRILSNACNNFDDNCIAGLEVNAKHCSEMLDKSLALSTKLVPVIGYNKAAEIAQEAHKTGKTIRELLLDMKIIDADKIDEILDPESMV